MQKMNRFRPSLERLEERATPAMFTVSNSGTTLTITQTAGAVGALSVTDNPSTGTIVLADTVSTTSLTVPGVTNLTLTLLSGDTSQVNYTLTGANRSGNLTINVNNSAARTLNFSTGTEISGDLTVRGGNGALTVMETGAGLDVGGNASFTGGNSLDVLNLGGVSGTAIGGTLTATRFNTLTLGVAGGLDTIGRSLSFNAAGDNNTNALTITDSTVGTSLTYTGGNGIDDITLAGATGASVAQALTVNLGSQGAADSSDIAINGASSVGSLSVTGGGLGTETVTLAATASIFNNVALNLGSGTNTATILGLIGGTSFSFIGGAGVDTITYTPAAASSRVSFSASLGAANDSVTFGAGANNVSNPSFASIDFGAGTDTVAGDLNFRFSFRNLP